MTNREYIKKFLHDHAITIEELANGIGKKRQHVNHYLNGGADSIDIELKAIDWTKQWVLENYPTRREQMRDKVKR